MAIGLGRIFGFHFLENFNYPYISQNIKEFWRRWHISLSSWFRDYLYIPLGGNKSGVTALYRNLLIVFVLCGFWHGANWNFLIWGLYHGLFLVLERTSFMQFLNRLNRPLRHSYTLIVVLVGWVFFRAETLGDALQYLRAMTGMSAPGAGALTIARLIDRQVLFFLGAGLLFSMPVYNYFRERLNCLNFKDGLFANSYLLVLFFLFILSTMQLISSSYNPFIYFRF